jgi:hypothetical protein
MFSDTDDVNDTVSVYDYAMCNYYLHCKHRQLFVWLQWQWDIELGHLVYGLRQHLDCLTGPLSFQQNDC